MSSTQSPGALVHIPRAASALLAVFGLATAITVLTPVTEWIASPLYLTPSPSTAGVDAIVVLEAWASADGELNESGTARVLRASELYARGASATVLITGSEPRPSRPDSALMPMVDLLARLGVPPRAILTEVSSQNTHESAVNVARIAGERRWSRIALVTDHLHMRRASMAFRRAGLDVVRAPTLGQQLGAAQPSARFTRVSALGHEYGGLLYYWWHGWI